MPSRRKGHLSVPSDGLVSPTQKDSAPSASPVSPLSPVAPWPPELPESPPSISSRSKSVAPAVEGVPTLPTAKEVYGSLAVLLTYIAGGLYLVWAFAPEGWLDQWGWTWYPDREWAVIVPCYLMFLVLLTYWSYAALTAYNTPSFDSPNLITDPFARIPPRIPGEDPYYWRFADEGAVPQAVDLPIDLVNRALYPPRPRPR